MDEGTGGEMMCSLRSIICCLSVASAVASAAAAAAAASILTAWRLFLDYISCEGCDYTTLTLANTRLSLLSISNTLARGWGTNKHHVHGEEKLNTINIRQLDLGTDRYLQI